MTESLLFQFPKIGEGPGQKTWIQIQNEPVKELKRLNLKLSASRRVRDDNGLTFLSISGNQQGGKSTYGMLILSEIFNTAIEAIIDLVSPEFNPLAKIAKDVAAGAVFMVSLGAVVTGYLILYPYIKSPFTDIVIYIEVASEHLTLISVILVIIAVILTKAHSKTGRPFYGGLPSGHSAVSFSIGTSIAFLTKNALISILSFILAFMVASSRVSLGIHTTREIILGALLGTVITVLLFQIFG